VAVPTPGAWRIKSLRPRTLAIAAVLAAVFAVLAVLTTLPAVAAWDFRIDLAVNNDVATDAALHTVALAVSAAGSPAAVDALTAIAVIIVWVWGARAWRVRAALYLVAARLLELGIETGVKYLMNRRRPVLPHTLATAQDPSFPSGHTAGTTVLCVSLLVLAWPGLSRMARSGWVVAAAAAIIAVGASRVLLGLHYVTDVLGGALLGTATALALASLLTPPGRDVPDGIPGPPNHR
jgi:membrane-associated phospholipid phosphatase